MSYFVYSDEIGKTDRYPDSQKAAAFKAFRSLAGGSNKYAVIEWLEDSDIGRPEHQAPRLEAEDRADNGYSVKLESE